MISKWIFLTLLVFYLILLIMSIWEGKNMLALYWLGAFILNIAVLEMAY